MNQLVTVEALMGQRYNGQHHGRGDQFQMTESDAADAVAVNFVRKVKAPAAAPVTPPAKKPEVSNQQLPIVTRDMPPEGKKSPDEDEDDKTKSDKSSDDADKPAADAASQSTSPAVAGRHGGNQQPYQNRNTHTRGSTGNRR